MEGEDAWKRAKMQHPLPPNVQGGEPTQESQTRKKDEVQRGEGKGEAMQWTQRKLNGGSGGAEPPSETVSNVQDYEPTEDSQTRKQMKWKEEKEKERQCNGPNEI